jgi:hypothetical protein
MIPITKSMHWPSAVRLVVDLSAAHILCNSFLIFISENLGWFEHFASMCIIPFSSHLQV